MKTPPSSLFFIFSAFAVFPLLSSSAQEALAPAVGTAGGPAPAALSGDAGYKRLRGISYFHIDVTSSTNANDEAELRNELRDIIELELRRQNLAVRALSPTDVAENALPFLRLNLKWERAMGRTDCVLELSVSDKVQILRNKEQIPAVIFEVRRTVGILTEQTAARDVKGRSRDLVREFVRGLKKNG
ncbi:MAG: hypothetical protein LBG65_06800 [Puniceicoccales bacterium]|jgi:hypothetical protein|nr:hypothetical protein [Puniceicoccales bacterium]